MTATTAPATFAGKTAEQWEEMARQCRLTSQDSWERADTDGYLSQWANDQMASRYLHNAEHARNGGVMEIHALFKDGEIVPGARNVQGRYGWTWVHDDENGRPVWLSESKAQSAEKRRAYFLSKHEGYSVGWVKVKAGLNSRSNEAYPIRDEVVEVLTTDDADFSDEHNNVY